MVYIYTINMFFVFLHVSLYILGSIVKQHSRDRQIISLHREACFIDPAYDNTLDFDFDFTNCVTKSSSLDAWMMTL